MVRVTLLSCLFFVAALCGCDSAPAAANGNRLRFETTKGNIVIELMPDAAPLGVARVKELVAAKFYDDAAFFRVVPGFVVQFGMAADPAVNAQWRSKPIQDEPVKGSNKRGYLTFAKTGAPNSRTTQLFINLADNANLDSMGFAPIGKVVEGMDVVDKINAEYRERPQQPAIEAKGNAYLKAEFPKLDFIKTATIQ